MKTQSLLCSFVLMCIGGMALQAQEYEYVPIVRENVRWTFSDQKEKMTLLLDNRYIEGKLYAYAYMPDFSFRTDILIFLREENKVVYQLDINIDPFDSVPMKSEIPIYDFNVEQAGDTMWAWHNDPPYFGMVVEWIDTILIDDTYRRRIKLKDVDGVCIEGIGYTGKRNNLYYPFCNPDTEAGTKYLDRLEAIENIEGRLIYQPEWSRLGTYEYVPFVREGVKWGYDECYRFDGDTVVGGVSYKKCYVSESCPFEEGQTLYGLAREEDRVVYCLRPGDEQETVLYDFSVEKPGDRVSTRLNPDGEPLMRIDTIAVNNDQLRRRIKLLSGSYIEGFGSLEPCRGFFFPFEATAEEIGDPHNRIGYIKNMETGDYEYKGIVNTLRDECEFGRSYEPFVRDCEYGYYQANYHYHNGDLTGDYVHYRIAGDTLINGKAYKNISLTGECPDWERIPPAEQIREENRKVYFRYKEEEMGYDFNLTKGDGIILSDVHHALDTDINITVYDVKTVEFAGKERKCIYFKNSYGYYTGYWMEGIGDMNQGTLWTFDDHEGCPYPDIPCDEYTHILYYLRENGEYIYLQDNHNGTPLDDGNCILAVGETRIAALRIARTPDALVVTLPGDGYRLAELIDTTGRLVWCEYLDGEPGEVIIPTTGLASGIYVVTLTDNRGGRIVQKVAW
ncbi:T9SS type A sorting domain-containing protein [Barnesiella intestinihominis]|uniref:T9SS type A sorting domain-containing protein n=1 Tax=Barnesiella intestinihominis TaxID=487174 RepID=UPI00266BC1EE|nr:hypothetical protein [Barnesiella intestinihominis]